MDQRIFKPRRALFSSIIEGAKKNTVLSQGELMIVCKGQHMGQGKHNIYIGDGSTPMKDLNPALYGDTSEEDITITADTSTNYNTVYGNIASGKGLGAILGSLKQAINLLNNNKAAVNHTHSQYASTAHNHDGVYAKLNNASTFNELHMRSTDANNKGTIYMHYLNNASTAAKISCEADQNLNLNANGSIQLSSRQGVTTNNNLKFYTNDNTTVAGIISPSKANQLKFTPGSGSNMEIDVNGYVQLRRDGEGGNVRVVSKSGVNYMEMDMYNNETCRIYSAQHIGQSDQVTGGVEWKYNKYYNLDDFVTASGSSVAYATRAGYADNAGSVSSVNWSAIQGRPSTFTAGGGSANYSTQSGTATYAGSAGSVNWNNIQNKPTTFTAGGGSAAYSTQSGTATYAGSAGSVSSIGSKAKLWEDSEGGNLRLTSANGNYHVEMDMQPGNKVRMYTGTNQSELTGQVSFSVGKNIDLDTMCKVISFDANTKTLTLGSV